MTAETGPAPEPVEPAGVTPAKGLVMPKSPSTPTVISTGPIPGSRRIYLPGPAGSRIPAREIPLSAPRQAPGKPAKTADPAFVVYDTSGPYTDPAITTDINKGLQRLRESWIAARNDTVIVEGRRIKPEDDGLHSFNDVEAREVCPATRSHVRVAKAGANVSQMHYARQGIITPEMEYVAARENLMKENLRRLGSNWATDPKRAARLKGDPRGAILPDEVTGTFVRDEVARGRAVDGRLLRSDRIGGFDHAIGVQRRDFRGNGCSAGDSDFADAVPRHHRFADHWQCRGCRRSGFSRCRRPRVLVVGVAAAGG
mgnify:CR=1 FL=1